MEESAKQKASKSARSDSPKSAYDVPRLIRYGDIAKLTEAVAGSIDDFLSLGMKNTGDLG
jgi:hypothetical protein